MRALLLVPLLLAGCASPFARSDTTGPVGVYTMDEITVRVIYEDKETREIVKEALYWYNVANETNITLEDEAFLTQVLPVLNSRVERGLIHISRDEAGRFYRDVFRSISNVSHDLDYTEE